MLVSCVQSIFIGTAGPSLSSVKALGTAQQNKAYFTKIVYKHWNMNHVPPFLVCGASSEDSLPSGRFQHRSLLVRRNETQRNNEQCGKLFRSCYRGTMKLQKSQNKSCTQTSAAQILSSSGQLTDIWWTEVHQLLLPCTYCITSKSKWVCCYFYVSVLWFESRHI